MIAICDQSLHCVRCIEYMYNLVYTHSHTDVCRFVLGIRNQIPAHTHTPSTSFSLAHTKFHSLPLPIFCTGNRHLLTLIFICSGVSGVRAAGGMPTTLFFYTLYSAFVQGC